LSTDLQNSPTRTSADKLWIAIIAVLVIAGLVLAVGIPLVTTAMASIWQGVHVLLVAVMVAAIRSVRR
jgi:phosphotransferase system  glucose/maltose/N-acetylglucosamine-specific IIC component